jgi:hypothetical protein
MSSFGAALKVYYTNDKVESVVLDDNPLLALLPKMTKFEGSTLPIPIIIGLPNGRSASFATAQTNAASSRIESFVLTRVKNYGVALIDNETMKASGSNKGAWFEARTQEIDGILKQVSRSLAIQLYGTGSGALGAFTATVTNSYFTVTNIDDITNFTLNQRVVFGAAPEGTAPVAGALYVVQLDRDLGQVYCSTTLGGAAQALNTVATGAPGGSMIAAGFVYPQGDTGGVAISGLRAWLPDAAPGAALFFGVDRTADTTGLGGIRFDGSALSIEEALQKAAYKAKQLGARPSHVFMNPVTFGELAISLGSKVIYDVAKSTDGKFGFDALVLHTPAGKIKVVADANCPSTRAFMLTIDTWKLCSLGPAPQVLQTDGNYVLRTANADSVEVRTGYYAQLGCSAPGWNVNIKLA